MKNTGRPRQLRRGSKENRGTLKYYQLTTCAMCVAGTSVLASALSAKPELTGSDVVVLFDDE